MKNIIKHFLLGIMLFIVFNFDVYTVIKAIFLVELTQAESTAYRYNQGNYDWQEFLDHFLDIDTLIDISVGILGAGLMQFIFYF